jgi:nucleotide-binding universal stress UspA family protein
LYKHMLVATDGSKLSGKAVLQAIELAQALSAKLTAFYSTPDYPIAVFPEGAVYNPRNSYAATMAKEAEKILSAIKTEALAHGVECATLHAIAPAPWEAILAAAKKAKCDAIVMASHGRRGLAAVLLGSETQKVLTYSKLPVLVVR